MRCPCVCNIIYSIDKSSRLYRRRSCSGTRNVPCMLQWVHVTVSVWELRPSDLLSEFLHAISGPYGPDRGSAIALQPPNFCNELHTCKHYNSLWTPVWIQWITTTIAKWVLSDANTSARIDKRSAELLLFKRRAQGYIYPRCVLHSVVTLPSAHPKHGRSSIGFFFYTTIST